MNRPIPLHRLAAGQHGLIAQISGCLQDVQRLREFGLRDGARIQMFRPGNPCIIHLSGGKVCLRLDDRLAVMVQPSLAAG